jgi:hypothetical protein
MLRRIEVIAAEAEVLVATVAHAGDGNIHPLMVFDPNDAQAAARAHMGLHAPIGLRSCHRLLEAARVLLTDGRLARCGSVRRSCHECPSWLVVVPYRSGRVLKQYQPIHS